MFITIMAYFTNATNMTLRKIYVNINTIDAPAKRFKIVRIFDPYDLRLKFTHGFLSEFIPSSEHFVETIEVRYGKITSHSIARIYDDEYYSMIFEEKSVAPIERGRKLRLWRRAKKLQRISPSDATDVSSYTYDDLCFSAEEDPDLSDDGY